MQAFQISTGPPAGPKNYVFVDEHNRSKRLKVMRACEGCRRRKIKCDAATTNTWPCAACKRLKLPCVPPTGGMEGDQSNDQAEVISVQEPRKASTQNLPSHYDPYSTHFTNISNSNMPSYENYDLHVSQPVLQPPQYHYLHTPQIQPPPLMTENFGHRLQPTDSGTASQPSTSSPKSMDEQTAEVLAEQLGDLRIAENGMAPYTRQAKTSEPAGPIHEVEVDLPPLSTAAGSQIRIPPALMPSDEDAAELFQLFFDNIHPYVPVICRSHFYHQWHHDRASISPLLLEAIFACAGRINGDPVGDSPWLALANKHEASFLDTPRLSTIQALILLLKAREGSPKRGYFYKSWMRCKTIVSMARDMELHEHLATHQAGESCDSSPADCLTKTRAWQTILACEMMIGAPQGRLDFGVDPDTVDYSTNPPNSDIDEFEIMISRQFAYFTRNVKNIVSCVASYLKLRKKKDWALDPLMLQRNEDFNKWPDTVPSDLDAHISDADGLPHFTSHFIANMQSHYQLGVVMLHRPQLTASKSFATDEQWRHHMSVCYQAAKKLCRYQEAIVSQFDITGLLCMQRGMSFTIYAILTCVMIHLIAITSPDPEFNTEAREYFVRHMRLLEKCMSEFPMAETEQQINNLRAAFSADLDKPFDLRKTFPYGSPARSEIGPRRASGTQSPFSHSTEQSFYGQHLPQSQTSFFPTPPISAGTTGDSTPHTPQYYHTIHQSQPQFRPIGPTSYPQGSVSGNEQWNPQPIIDQFNTAFAIPPSALAPPPSNSTYGSSPPVSLTSGMPQQFTPSPQTPTYDLHSFAIAQQQAQAQLHPQSHQVHSSHLSAISSQHGQPHQYYDPTMNTITQAHVPTIPSQPQMPHIPHPSHQQQQPNHFIPSDIRQPKSEPSSNNTPTINHHIIPPNGHPQQRHRRESSIHNPGMVFVSPKEWQQSVASVFDSGGVKRRWEDDESAQQHLNYQQQQQQMIPQPQFQPNHQQHLHPGQQQ